MILSFINRLQYYQHPATNTNSWNDKGWSWNADGENAVCDVRSLHEGNRTSFGTFSNACY